MVLERNGKIVVDEKQLLVDCIDKAETVVTSAQHQKRIVDDILTLSKLNSGLLAITPFTVDPKETVGEAFKMFEVEARQYKVELRTVVDKSFDELGLEFLDFDPSRVRQILINLLTNALKFTKSQPTRTVTVCIKASRTRPDQQPSNTIYVPRLEEKDADLLQPTGVEGTRSKVMLIFDVQDTGRGLSEGSKASVFDKFVQATPQTHVKHGGSGLGLYICRRLTQLQHGAIGVSSEPGVGSTFTFFIEACEPTEEAKKTAQETRAGRRNKKREKAKKDIAKEIGLDGILVVEDNEINQKLTREGLKYRGFRVEVANHGVEALERLMQSARNTKGTEAANLDNPDTDPAGQSTANKKGKNLGPLPVLPSSPPPLPLNLVLMDMEMPVMDGLECTRRIRALEAQGHVFCARGGRMPIIGVSANARPEQVLQAKQAGCDEVVVKPYRMTELVDKMKDIFEGVYRRGSSGQVSLAEASGTPVIKTIVTKPTVAEPTVAEPTIAEPTVTEPTVTEPIVLEPEAAKTTVAEPVVATVVPLEKEDQES